MKTCAHPAVGVGDGVAETAWTLRGPGADAGRGRRRGLPMMPSSSSSSEASSRIPGLRAKAGSRPLTTTAEASTPRNRARDLAAAAPVASVLAALELGLAPRTRERAATLTC